MNDEQLNPPAAGADEQEAPQGVNGATGHYSQNTQDQDQEDTTRMQAPAGANGLSATETNMGEGAPGEEPGATSGEAAPSEGQAGSDELVVHSTRDSRLNSVAPNASMEDLLRASEQQYRTLKHGDVLEGTVMRVDREEILVDIGAKTEGVIPAREAQSLSDAEREKLQVGDPLLISVVQPESAEGHTILSLDRARQEKAWRDLQRQFEAGETIMAQVVGHNKGGLLVNIEGIRGFIPSSQVSSIPPGEANKQGEMSRLHGQTLSMKIIEINRHRNRLILSERQAMQEQRESMRARLLQELEPGQIRPGTVTSVCDFGAFVDIGGADGLIHLSELSWKRVSHPSEVLKVGDRINVYVLSVDPKERKIALSLKRTQPEPWDTITEQYQLGQVVRGTITQITSFGAFARLEDGIEGLIHVSELAEGRVAHPRNVVHEGQQLDLKVIRIDPARKRIGLSLKRMQEEQPPTTGPAVHEEASTAAPEQESAPRAEAASVQPQQPEPAAQAQGQPQQAERPTQPQPQRPEQRHAQPQQGGQRREERGGRHESREGREGRGDRERGREGRPQFEVHLEEEEEPLGALGQALVARLGRPEPAERERRQPQPQPEPQPQQAPQPEQQQQEEPPTTPREELPAIGESDTISGRETESDADATSAMDRVDMGEGAGTATSAPATPTQESAQPQPPTQEIPTQEIPTQEVMAQQPPSQQETGGQALSEPESSVAPAALELGESGPAVATAEEGPGSGDQPEAMMPAAADIAEVQGGDTDGGVTGAAEQGTSIAPASAQMLDDVGGAPDEGVTGSGAVSGSEGIPSTGEGQPETGA